MKTILAATIALGLAMAPAAVFAEDAMSKPGMAKDTMDNKMGKMDKKSDAMSDKMKKSDGMMDKKDGMSKDHMKK